MPRTSSDVEHALEVFVRGFCAGKSRTHPYEFSRVGKLWWLRDAERKNTRLYRKEEWIAFRTPASEVDSLARKHTRGRFFVCALNCDRAKNDELRCSYKELGYRLLGTESLFVHRLKTIARSKPVPAQPDCDAVRIEQITTADMAARFGKATRTRPIEAADLGRKAPFRQYVAVEGEQLVGWVRSINAGDSTWCSNMYVRPTHRRRGIGRALLSKMLQDDRRHKFKQSVLLASHAGALLYPHVGYELLGTLLILAPRKK